MMTPTVDEIKQMLQDWVTETASEQFERQALDFCELTGMLPLGKDESCKFMSTQTFDRRSVREMMFLLYRNMNLRVGVIARALLVEKEQH